MPLLCVGWLLSFFQVLSAIEQKSPLGRIDTRGVERKVLTIREPFYPSGFCAHAARRRTSDKILRGKFFCVVYKEPIPASRDGIDFLTISRLFDKQHCSRFFFFRIRLSTAGCHGGCPYYRGTKTYE
ncbi:unnamed protein product [Pylaiella littoralis]